ncbi:MFS general substrate transporter [Punctularia strigosozonata HHB-11173 SS5]|uniref:MFS general substrate transporter n=1 Tax=Punctularia strigosozonata (strain HHB-11173) TaxID=741275 RepID=UPI0004418634|nr:MFS general substrate transporter [Punctularia strigosozonata HHB-11173 SS5]EIN12195.1 MFS general substrate transporter [Punctularia strigosozonata HHB-11173 SS5]
MDRPSLSPPPYTAHAHDLKMNAPAAAPMMEEKPVPPAPDATAGGSATPSQVESQVTGPCDGGLRAWLCVFGAFVGLFATFGQITSFGTYQAYYSSHPHLSRYSPSTIAWIGSAQLWMWFFSGAFVGRVSDKHGPFIVMVGGTSICFFSLVATSLSTQYYQLILGQGFLFGLGTGMIFYPSLAAVSTHFSRRRATALGIAISGSSAGGVVFPLINSHLLHATNARTTALVSAGITTACCIVVLLTVRKCETSTVTPTAAAVIPSPASSDDAEKKEEGGGEAPHRRWAPCDVSLRRATPFFWLTVGSVFTCFGIFIPNIYIVDYANALSFSPSLVSAVLPALNAGSVLGRILPALLADSLGRYTLLAPSALLSGLACLVLWLTARTVAGVLAFAIAYGFCSGAFTALVTPCVAQISEPGQVATRLGILYSILSIPALTGGPLAGALIRDHHMDYTAPIAFAGTTMVLGSVFLLVARVAVSRDLRARV